METSVVPAPLAAALLEAGYRIGGPAGVGGGGPVWTATRVAPAGPGAPGRVVLRVLTLPDDAARARLAGRLEALWALDHPHLPAVVDVVVVPSGASGGEVWAVLLAEVPGATVEALLAARGRLSTGEVVTLTVPVAGALDALHRCGLVHGDVSPANVVVRPDGRPVLIDVLGGVAAEAAFPDGGTGPVRRGTPGFVAPEVSASHVPAGRAGAGAGGAATDALAAGAPADVFALAAVALAALDLAEHAGRLADELRAATAADAVRRPTAAELAAAVYACADPEPIAQPDAGVLARTALAQLAAPSRTVSVPTGGRHRAGAGRRAPGRRGPVARGHRRLAAVVLAGAVAVSGVAWAVADRGGPDPAAAPGPSPDAAAVPGPAAGPPAPGASPAARAAGETGQGRSPAAAPAPPDPVDAAVALTRRRVDVLAAGDPRRLAEVVVPDSPAHRADRALLDRLAADAVTLDGVTALVEGAEVVTPAAAARSAGAAAERDVVDVRVRSGLSAHTRRSPSGAVEVPAQPARPVVLRLTLTRDGWRVSEVRPA